MREKEFSGCGEEISLPQNEIAPAGQEWSGASAKTNRIKQLFSFRKHRKLAAFLTASVVSVSAVADLVLGELQIFPGKAVYIEAETPVEFVMQPIWLQREDQPPLPADAGDDLNYEILEGGLKANVESPRECMIYPGNFFTGLDMQMGREITPYTKNPAYLEYQQYLDKDILFVSSFMEQDTILLNLSSKGEKYPFMMKRVPRQNLPGVRYDDCSLSPGDQFSPESFIHGPNGMDIQVSPVLQIEGMFYTDVLARNRNGSMTVLCQPPTDKVCYIPWTGTIRKQGLCYQGLLPVTILDSETGKKMDDVYGDQREIHFRNPDILEAVERNGRHSMDKSGSYTRADLAEIEYLRIILQNNTDLSDLQYFKGLRTLFIGFPKGSYQPPLNLDLSCFKNMPFLQNLYLESARSISELENTTWLRTLILKNCGNGAFPENLKLPHLETLCIQGQTMKELSDLSQMPKLSQLQLRDTGIRNLNCLSDMENMECLLLQNNSVEDLSFLKTLPRLYGLAMENSGKPDLNQIAGAKNLEILYLHKAEIFDVSPLNVLKKLRVLSLCHNQIGDISIIQDLKNLNELRIDGNEVSDLSVLDNMPYMRYLSFNGNLVSDISPVMNLKKLQALYAAENKITHIGNISQLQDLHELNLGKNQITSGADIHDLPNLRTLVLSDNSISDVSAMQNLPNLESLNLSACGVRIETIPEYPELKNLLLPDNQISDIGNLHMPKEMYLLDLNNNRLRDLTPLKKLNSVWVLSLGENQIQDLSPLQHFPFINVLDLTGNQIDDMSVLASMQIRACYIAGNNMALFEELPGFGSKWIPASGYFTDDYFSEHLYPHENWRKEDRYPFYEIEFYHY